MHEVTENDKFKHTQATLSAQEETRSQTYTSVSRVWTSTHFFTLSFAPQVKSFRDNDFASV